MLAFTNADDKQSPSVIGAGCKINGDIKSDLTVQVHGTVTGDISASIVVIGRGGHVVGDITAETLFLHGDLQGSATVNTANIFSNAKMSGVLTYRTLNITCNTELECKLAKRKETKDKKNG